MNNTMKSFLILVLLLTTTFLTSAWAAGPNIVVSIKPLQLIVEAISGDLSKVEVLVPSNQDIHDYSLKPSALKRLSKSDIVVWLGPTIEPYFANALKITGESKKHLQLTVHYPQGVDDRPEQQNPHVWLDQTSVIRFATTLASLLTQMDSMNRAHYRANLEKFIAQLGEFHDKALNKLRQHSTRNYLVYHDAYYYFEQNLGLAPLSIIQLSENLRPTIKHVSHLQSLVADGSVSCIVSEPGASKSLLQLIMGARDVPVIILDPLASNIAPSISSYVEFLDGLLNGFLSCFESTIVDDHL